MFKVGKNCQIHPSVVIDVKVGFIGDGAVIREGARIEGQRVEIGRECFLDRGATIGGGSCFDPEAFLVAGDWLHMGVNSHINTARGVRAGHEFGCGIETKIFTHGAYIDSYALGAPVQWEGVEIGDNVWMPNAWVNPGVKIGDNVVVSARSLINKDLPSGSLAAGVPAKVLRENWLPRDIGAEAKKAHLEKIIEQARARHGEAFAARVEGARICGADTIFDVQQKTIHGAVTPAMKILKDQLRRNGIRFRYEEGPDSAWIAWYGRSARTESFRADP